MGYKLVSLPAAYQQTKELLSVVRTQYFTLHKKKYMHRFLKLGKTFYVYARKLIFIFMYFIDNLQLTLLS